MKKNKIGILFGCMLAILLSVQVYAFSDVSETDWFADEVEYVSQNGLMSGVGNDRFAPELSVSRGMLVTILFRMENSPSGYDHSAFSDVKSGSYYESAVAWASQNGIVTGYNEKAFGPEDDVTREQFAAILRRYAKYKNIYQEKTAAMDAFGDFAQVSSYAVEAMKWANAMGYINGTSATTLSPKGTATRAQTAAIIMRFAQSQGEAENAPESAPQPAEQHSAVEHETHETQHEEAAENTVIAVRSVTAEKGKQATVNVDLKNNPGIVGATLMISYDESVMTMIEAKNGEAFQDALTFIPAKRLKSGGCFVWYATDVEQSQIKDGSILQLVFQIGETASGTYPIHVTVAPGDTIDRNLSAVDAALVEGAITIN